MTDTAQEQQEAAETVAARADAAVPYVREWLRSQAAAGYVGYDPAAATFRLAPGVAAALGEGPLSGLTGGLAAQFRVWWSELDRYEDAFRTGRGISWGSLPAGHADGMDLITRAEGQGSAGSGWMARSGRSPSAVPRPTSPTPRGWATSPSCWRTPASRCRLQSWPERSPPPAASRPLTVGPWRPTGAGCAISTTTSPPPSPITTPSMPPEPAWNATLSSPS